MTVKSYSDVREYVAADWSGADLDFNALFGMPALGIAVVDPGISTKVLVIETEGAVRGSEGAGPKERTLTFPTTEYAVVPVRVNKIKMASTVARVQVFFEAPG